MSQNEGLPQVNTGDLEDTCTCSHERIWHVTKVTDTPKGVETEQLHCVRTGCPCMAFEPDWGKAFGASPASGPSLTPDKIDATKLAPRDRYVHVVMGCASIVEIIREFPLEMILGEMVQAEQILKSAHPGIWQERGRIMLANRHLLEAAHKFRESCKGLPIEP